MIAAATLVADVECSLRQQPRQLPSKYLYDDLGSAQLQRYRLAGLLLFYGASYVTHPLRPLRSLYNVLTRRYESRMEMSFGNLVRRLSQSGVRVNVTAVMTLSQVERLTKSLDGGAPSNISIFAGRIADTGVDPVPMISKASKAAKAGKTIHLVGRADQAEIVKAEMIREGAPANAILVAREPVKALPKVDSLSDAASRKVEIKF